MLKLLRTAVYFEKLGLGVIPDNSLHRCNERFAYAKIGLALHTQPQVISLTNRWTHVHPLHSRRTIWHLRILLVFTVLQLSVNYGLICAILFSPFPAKHVIRLCRQIRHSTLTASSRLYSVCFEKGHQNHTSLFGDLEDCNKLSQWEWVVNFAQDSYSLAQRLMMYRVGMSRPHRWPLPNYIA
jgi:hypothetical protein